MGDGRVNVQFCGFGGQEIILSAVIFGTTAVTKAGMNAVQTQSYGSEARGGECQAEVIVSIARTADEVLQMRGWRRIKPDIIFFDAFSFDTQALFSYDRLNSKGGSYDYARHVRENSIDSVRAWSHW